MYVDVAQPLRHESVGVDEGKHLLVLRCRRAWQSLQKFDDRGPVLEVATRQFADHKRMTHGLARLEHLCQTGASVS